MEVSCFHCQKTTTSLSKIGFRDECLSCRTDLHVCKNCEFYDVKSHHECREHLNPNAELVREKERANLCELFSASKKKSTGITDEKARLKSAAEALFKK